VQLLVKTTSIMWKVLFFKKKVLDATTFSYESAEDCRTDKECCQPHSAFISVSMYLSSTDYIPVRLSRRNLTGSMRSQRSKFASSTFADCEPMLACEWCAYQLIISAWWPLVHKMEVKSAFELLRKTTKRQQQVIEVVVKTSCVKYFFRCEKVVS